MHTQKPYRTLFIAALAVGTATLMILGWEMRPGRASRPAAAPEPAAPPASTMKAEDRTYLLLLSRDTWNYLAQHVDARTGFPTDTQRPGGTTNTTNIGLYLACVGIATEMKLEPRQQALARVRKVLDGLEKLDSRHGFFNNWVSVEGDTKLTPGVSAVSDFNKTVAGLILVRQLFPEVAERASALIDRVEWSWVYNQEKGVAYYGYNLVENAPVGESRLWFAADVRLAAFMLVASGAAPVEFWDRMERREIHAGDLTFFWPGYKMGGLFMQGMDGIFLDERGAEMGRSFGNLVWHQIGFAQSRQLPVWGWSNCDVPGAGYTEGGYLPWWVVTPHASVLAIDYYPQRVIRNLRALEKLGLRQPLPGSAGAFGFRDAIDLRTKALDDRYLCLDQAMLFLSLANYLENGIVRRTFAKDPLVARGLKTLGDRLRSDPVQLAEWARRDALAGPSTEAKIDSSRSSNMQVIDLRAKKSAVTIAAKEFKPGALVQTARMEQGLVIDFDLGPGGEGEAEVKVSIPRLDARGLEQVTIVASGLRRDGAKEKWGVRVSIADDQDQDQYAYLGDLSEKMTAHVLPDAARFGIFARPDSVTTVTFRLWAKPWFFTHQKTQPRKGQIVIEKMIFSFAPAT